jgi:hypothetical protein
LWIIPVSAGGANRSSAVFRRYRSVVASTRACHPERGFYAKDLNFSALLQFPLGACHPESPFVAKWFYPSVQVALSFQATRGIRFFLGLHKTKVDNQYFAIP